MFVCLFPLGGGVGDHFTWCVVCHLCPACASIFARVFGYLLELLDGRFMSLITQLRVV